MRRSCRGAESQLCGLCPKSRLALAHLPLTWVVDLALGALDPFGGSALEVETAMEAIAMGATGTGEATGEIGMGSTQTLDTLPTSEAVDTGIHTQETPTRETHTPGIHMRVILTHVTRMHVTPTLPTQTHTRPGADLTGGVVEATPQELDPMTVLPGGEDWRPSMTRAAWCSAAEAAGSFYN